MLEHIQSLYLQDQVLNQVDDSLFLNMLQYMDQQYQFFTNQNSEIKYRWLTLCLYGKYEKSYQYVVQMIITQGRMKFTRPLYRLLFQVNSSLAIKTFQLHQNFYNPICAKMVAKDLGLVVNEVMLKRKTDFLEWI